MTKFAMLTITQSHQTYTLIFFFQIKYLKKFYTQLSLGLPIVSMIYNQRSTIMRVFTFSFTSTDACVNVLKLKAKLKLLVLVLVLVVKEDSFNFSFSFSLPNVKCFTKSTFSFSFDITTLHRRYNFINCSWNIYRSMAEGLTDAQSSTLFRTPESQLEK